MHRSRLAAVTLALVASSGRAAPAVPPEAEAVLLTGASLIDGTGAPARDDVWIHVENGRIAALGGGAPPPDSGGRRIDLRGKTVIPGLSDMHVHLGDVGQAPWILKLLLAHGVTTVKETGNSLGNVAAIRRWMTTDRDLPRVAFSSPSIQGSYEDQRFLQKGSEVEWRVEDAIASGVDFIKVYNWLSSAGLVQVVELARARGVPVTGHTPLSMTSVGAIDAGMTILEHVRMRPWEVLDDPRLVSRYPIDGSFMRRTSFWAHFDGDTQASARTLSAWEERRDRFFITPTLVVQEKTASGYDPGVAENPDLRLVSRAALERWKAEPRDLWGVLDAEGVAEAKASTAGMTRFIGQAHERGVRVLTGSDIGMAWVVPGVSLHRELELLQEAGLAPIAIVRASTGLAAEALGTPERGTLQPGHVADLVIVAARLADDIRGIARIEQVMLAGKLHDRSRLLAEAERYAARDEPRVTP